MLESALRVKMGRPGIQVSIGETHISMSFSDYETVLGVYLLQSDYMNVLNLIKEQVELFQD